MDEEIKKRIADYEKLSKNGLEEIKKIFDEASDYFLALEDNFRYMHVSDLLYKLHQIKKETENFIFRLEEAKNYYFRACEIMRELERLNGNALTDKSGGVI